MKFAELFAGIGGFRLGLERAGHKCVWTSEWLEKPRQIYYHNFKEMPDARDIRIVHGRELPEETELLVGGFPCGTFSVCGKRAGFSVDDTRGTLCFEMFRIAMERKIPYILFENVEGLLTHDNGRTFGIILSALDELGYDAQWEVLDSKNFGVPQHRERVFVVASFRGKPIPKVFPIGQGKDGNIQGKLLDKKQARTLTARLRKGIGNTASRIIGSLINCEKGERVNTLDEIVNQFINEGEKFAIPILTPDRLVKRQNGKRYKEEDSASFTLTAQNKHGVITCEKNKSAIRKLTPLECERLQGLPDDWTKYLEYPDEIIKINSDADRYERCGRAVTIPVIEAIGKKLGYEWY